MKKISAITKIAQALSSIPYCDGLDSDTPETVAKTTVQQRYEADQIVFVDGEPCLGLYIVKDGWLEVYKRSFTGREQVIRFIGSGEAFNEIGVLAEGKNLVKIQALGPHTVWIITREALFHLMDKYPPRCRSITRHPAKKESLAPSVPGVLGVHDLRVEYIKPNTIHVDAAQMSEKIADETANKAESEET